MANRTPNRSNLESFHPNEAARFLIQSEGEEAFDFVLIRKNESWSTSERDFWYRVGQAIGEIENGGAR